MLIAGIDLAWGEKLGDGLCLIRHCPGSPAADRILVHDYLSGDDALMAALLAPLITPDEAVFAAIDAPVICRNATGRRPADAAVSAAFRSAHAGCYPVNLNLARRPLRVAARLRDREGFTLTTAPEGPAPWPERGWRVAAEVFPHPALVRWLGLDRIFEYKRKAGRSRDHAAAEFRRLQQALVGLLQGRFAGLQCAPDTAALLAAPWSKPVEDKVDALVCALIGLWHVRHAGARTEVFGDTANGFVLVPRADQRPDSSV